MTDIPAPRVDAEALKAKIEALIVKWRAHADSSLAFRPFIDAANAADELESLLSAGPSSAGPEPAWREVLAWVEEVASQEMCSDNPKACGLDSGPYCAAHGLDRDDYIWNAREVLAKYKSTLPVFRRPPAGD